VSLTRRAVLGLAVVALGPLLAACGVPSDGAPRAIDADRMPEDLLLPNTAEGVVGEGTGRIWLYDEVDGLLVWARRDIDETADAATRATQALELLLQGTNTAENERAITTRIPRATRLLGVSLDGDVLTIDLSEEFLDVQGSSQRIATGQLVLTADEFDEVRKVRLSVDGQLRKALTDTGEERDEVTSFDYAELSVTEDERPITPTPTTSTSTTTTSTTTTTTTTTTVPIDVPST